MRWHKRTLQTEVLAFAFDHRSQIEALSDDPKKISDFKTLCAEVVDEMATTLSGLGVLCDHRYGASALGHMQDAPIWIAGPIEWPGSRPLRFEGGDDWQGVLNRWRIDHVVKCLCFMHPDDEDGMWSDQRAQLVALSNACEARGLSLLVEVIPPKGSDIQSDTTARNMQLIYDAGIKPVWWKLPAPTDAHWDAAWQGWRDVISRNDPDCLGIVMLGLGAPMEEIKQVIARASGEAMCKGFAVGRSIFGDAAQAWFSGEMDDAAAKADMAAKYAELIAAWRSGSTAPKQG